MRKAAARVGSRRIAACAAMCVHSAAPGVCARRGGGGASFSALCGKLVQALLNPRASTTATTAGSVLAVSATGCSGCRGTVTCTRTPQVHRAAAAAMLHDGTAAGVRRYRTYKCNCMRGRRSQRDTVHMCHDHCGVQVCSTQ
jgi:hypothetical protein